VSKHKSPRISVQAYAFENPFGKAFELDWYLTVLEACALCQDISNFHLRDLEVLGDKGISLSGGQKARISLSEYNRFHARFKHRAFKYVQFGVRRRKNGFPGFRKNVTCNHN
jgi:hypothetical protein